MLLHTNKYIPQVYGKSRDIQVFTGLLDIIATCVKDDIDNLYYIYDPMKCPEQFLPLLAKTLNYSYDYTDTVLQNRRIIATFVELEKLKGSQRGLLVAVALSLISTKLSVDNLQLVSQSDIADIGYFDALKDLEINFMYKEGIIQIRYPSIFTRVKDLVDYVRPVGMSLEVVAATPMNINSDVMLLYADTDVTVRKYDPVADSGVSKNFVNLSTVGDPTFKEKLDDLSDGETLNLNT